MHSHGLFSRRIRIWAQLAPVVLAMGTASFASPPVPTTRNVPAGYATIQAAINAANPGDIVDVAAGTYHEQLTINKALTVTGPAGASGPGGSGRAVLDGSTLSPGITWTTGVKIRSGNVTLNNLDITNFTQDGITAYDNIDMPNLHITNCKISNIQPGYWGFGIYVGYESEGFDYSPPDLTTHLDFTGLLIEGNEITNVASSALVVQSITGTPGTLVVRNNWIHDNPDNDGIWIETARNVTFEDNTLERNLWGIEVTSISEPGFELNGALSPKDIVLRRNVIKESTDSGLTFYNAWPATFTIERNQFSGNLPYGVRNRISALSGSPVVAAPCNWWGHASGPSGPGFAGTGELLTANVSVASWLSSPDISVPDAPIIGVATGSDNTVSVTFTPACNDGGSVVLSYTATCGSESVTGASSPLVVEGLPFSPDVTCTVVATNAIGASLPSSASNSVTPQNAPSIAITNVSLSEAGGAMLFTVTRSGVPGLVTFDYATSDGAVSGTAATAGVDYHPLTASGQIPAGGTGVFTFSVQIVNEALSEHDEVFTVTLTNVVGATMASNTAVGTILNDDATPTISISKGAVTEGDSGTTPLTFTVTRNTGSDLPVTFNWASAAGTATGGASCGAGVDFITGSNSGLIPAGSGVASTTMTLLVCGDTLVEDNETLTVTLSNVSGATVDGTGIAVGTITENDLQRQVKIDQRAGSAIEGNSLTLTVSLNFVPGIPIAVNYVFKTPSQTGPPAIAAPTGGAACGGVVDFLYAMNPTTSTRTQTGTLIFLPGGSSTQTLTIPTCSDAVVDPGEMFRFSISQAPGYSALNFGNQLFNGAIN